MSDNYGINEIKSLSFREGVRCRVQMYLGSDDIDGTYQAFKEIVNNSTDEATAGYGDKIEIAVSEKENYIAVIDYGRGVPFGIRDDGENVLVSIYSKSHTGGKFEEGAYKNSSGLNGIGAKCVCLSSLKFEVQSNRDGKFANAYFEKGELISYYEGTTKEKNGTYVRFIPDPEVFKNGTIGYSYERICKEIHDISYLYCGLTFEVKNDDTNKKEVYCAKNGIMDFVKDNIEKPLHQHIIHEEVTDGTDKVEIAFQWGGGKESGYVFVNGLCCPEGGSPITGAKTAITKTFNSQSRQNFDGDSIRNGLVYVINCSVAQPSFANQTKSKINNASLRTLASNAFSNALKNMKLKYGNEFDSIVELMKKIAKAEVAAERARKQVLEGQREVEKAQKAKIAHVDKLQDARKIGPNATLVIVEGESAGGSIAMGRDENIGILKLRGKMLNLEVSSEEEWMKNEEVQLLQQALGIVYGKPYNSSKLRYGKIAIASDSDVDGSHISMLVTINLWNLCPEIIKENRLYRLEAPIYKVHNKNSDYFYYTESEFEKHEKGDIIKFKGLGQMEPEDLKKSMFSKEFQRLTPYEYTEEGIFLLQALMGDDVEPKRNFVFSKIDFNNLIIE